MKHQLLLIAPLLTAACRSNPAPPAAAAEVDASIAAPDCFVETFAIYFDEGASELSDEPDPFIVAVSQLYARCERDKIEIEVHTDAGGDEVAKQAISAARALAVLEALKTRGVDAERAHLVAYGAGGGVTDGGDVPLNRRTEVRSFPKVEFRGSGLAPGQKGQELSNANR